MSNSRARRVRLRSVAPCRSGAHRPNNNALTLAALGLLIGVGT